MFVEYHIPPLPNGQRGFHDAHLSQKWRRLVRRRAGLQIGKMDRARHLDGLRARGPQFRGHGLTQDAGGDIWASGHTGFVRVDSKTEQ